MHHAVSTTPIQIAGSATQAIRSVAPANRPMNGHPARLMGTKIVLSKGRPFVVLSRISVGGGEGEDLSGEDQVGVLDLFAVGLVDHRVPEAVAIGAPRQTP